MSYININEVDKTIQDLSPITSDNIVYIPLNSTDGPSGIYTLLQSYSDFTQIFGQDPDAGSATMTSWDYAANLLLRNMPVMVRRITNFIDEDGNDLPVKLDDVENSGPLPGVSYASTLLKVKDIDDLGKGTQTEVNTTVKQTLAKGWDDTSYAGMFPDTANNKGEEHFESVFGKLPASSNWDDVRGEFGVYITPTATDDAAQITVSAIGADKEITFKSANRSAYDEEKKSEYTALTKAYAKLGDGGKISIINNESVDSGSAMYITELKVIYNRSIRYDAKISDIVFPENATELTAESLNKSSYLKIYDIKNSVIVNKADVKIKKIKVIRKGEIVEVAALELPSDYKILYDNNMNMFSGNSATKTDSRIQVNVALTPKIATSTFQFIFNDDGQSKYSIVADYINDATPDSVVQSITYYEAKQTEDETVDNAAEFDGNGNINIFKVTYKYAGENGSRLAVNLKTVANDGIYLQVWNNTQRLENIQIANLRYKVSNSRFYKTLDIDNDLDTIWNLILGNFGISYPLSGDIALLKLKPLTTAYLNIELNANVDLSNSALARAIYYQSSTVRYSLTGGSSASSEDVGHEVYKTYAPLKDKYLYDVKFISNGGFVDAIVYPEDIGEPPRAEYRYVEDAQIDLAESRGDALALVDVPLELPREDTLEYFSRISTSYATAYAPWVELNLLTRETKWCPPSFAALWTIAKSVGRGNKVYAPPAGVNRANIPECSDLYFQIPAEYIDTWSDNYTQFINPIVYINGYGVNIFGQKTLYSRVDASYDTKSALQFLNTRLVANEVKKKIFKTCIELSFEYNNLRTWLAFKTKMREVLDPLYYNQAITYYDMKMDESTMTDADIRSNHIVGTVSVAVSTTAEKFDITFELLPNQVNFLNIDYSVDNGTQTN